MRGVRDVNGFIRGSRAPEPARTERGSGSADQGARPLGPSPGPSPDDWIRGAMAEARERVDERTTYFKREREEQR